MEDKTLPDGSMRFSLFEAWVSNKQKAMERYFLPEDQRRNFSTAWMGMGSHVAESLELRPIPWWLSDIKPADISEYRIIDDFDGYMIRGTLDKFMHEGNTVIDNKSLKRKMTPKEEKEMNLKCLFTLEDFAGLKNKFDEKDAKKYKKQLVFYQVLVENRHFFVNPTSYIEVIPVFKDIHGIIRRTGEPAEMVPVEITAQERAEMKKLMISTASDISIAYKAYLAGNIKL
jgi:hypothetical protein